jgi:gas vesicle protein
MKPTYTPEKIDEFVASAKKDVEAAKSLFTLAYEKILDINMGDAINSPESIKALSDKVKQIKSSIKKKTDTYYDVINMYETGEYPDNVSELDRVNDTLDSLGDDISKLYYALEDILMAVSELTGQFFNK